MTVQILYLSGTGAQPEEHGLTMLAMNTSSVLDWILIVGSAVILAPLKEELLFRGVAQFWFSRRSWGGHVAMIAAFIVAIVERYDKLHQAIVKHTWSLLVHELQPALFVIALIPVYLVLPRLLSRRFPLPEVPRAIFGTSLLFGVFHSTVWPTPIPLFVLGLVLGWLAYRTQSLTAPIVLHALFNAVACLGLALLR